MGSHRVALLLDRCPRAFHMPGMSLIQNERTKLTANALDRASTACLTVGALGPAVASLYGLGGMGSAAPSHGALIALGSVFWLVAAAVLHFMARSVLGRLI
ncbi:hypothetical protein [Xanthobacter sp. 126]|jgi:hypothetical protein|uniref:hypothetical protein n=1 Tax=Xanthobacter sp. 126 TaxID=1131814 RepID=UPI00045E84E0|nr:hypothetical protein [Xanthobacter sp. 126]